MLKFILNSDSYIISIIIRFRIFCSVSIYFCDQEKALKSLLLLQPSLRITPMEFLGLLPPICSGAKGTASMSPPHLWPHQCPGCDPSLLGQPWLWHLEGTPGARQGPFLSLSDFPVGKAQNQSEQVLEKGSQCSWSEGGGEVEASGQCPDFHSGKAWSPMLCPLG